jgi:phosphoribosylformimino-5-aminoimidazole carboxamide ribotide isomerase
MDILNGIVVHGVRGLRNQYHPLSSVLVDGADPVRVVEALVEKLGIEEIYIAELDMIMGKSTEISTLNSLRSLNARFYVDSGIKSVEQAESVARMGFVPVIGSETLPNLELVPRLISRLGADSLIFSLDTKNGMIVSVDPRIDKAAPEDVARKVAQKGMENFILLEMDRVGTQAGMDLTVVQKVLESVPGELLVGGGIGSINSIRILASLGCSGCLVATMLHRGGLSRRDIQEIKSLSVNRSSQVQR